MFRWKLWGDSGETEARSCANVEKWTFVLASLWFCYIQVCACSSTGKSDHSYLVTCFFFFFHCFFQLQHVKSFGCSHWWIALARIYGRFIWRIWQIRRKLTAETVTRLTLLSPRTIAFYFFFFWVFTVPQLFCILIQSTNLSHHVFYCENLLHHLLFFLTILTLEGFIESKTTC